MNPKTGEMWLRIGSDILIVDGFLTDTNGLQVRTLDIDEQKRIAQMIVQNVLNT